jgi:hypothetical protein
MWPQLGVLAALSLETHPPAVAALPWLNDTLPELASLLVFELHATQQPQEGAPALAVRLVAQQVQRWPIGSFLLSDWVVVQLATGCRG